MAKAVMTLAVFALGFSLAGSAAAQSDALQPASNNTERATVRGGAPISPNDECAGALSLTCGASMLVDLATGTSNAADPLYTCRIPSAARGVNTLWYTFVPTSSHAILTTGIVSGGSADDTLLAVYSGACGSLVQVGCNDDFGGLRTSRVEMFGLTAGQTYHIQVAG